MSQVVALVARSDAQLSENALQTWAADEMAPYQASLTLLHLPGPMLGVRVEQ
jgi:hypothetical protein